MIKSGDNTEKRGDEEKNYSYTIVRVCACATLARHSPLYDLI